MLSLPELKRSMRNILCLLYTSQVPRKAGWDTHGLPVELEVEKKLGLDGKDQIEKYGVEPFIEQCKELSLIHI